MRIDLDNILLSRGGFTIRCNGTFDEGIHLVSGPVGSGKSTLALLLAALIRPDQGTVRKEGISSTLISLQFPEYHVTSATVSEEIGTWGLDPEVVLSRTGLLDRSDVDPFHLSRGELKRLNLACTIARDPDLLLLDEPFSSLDCSTKHTVCRMVEGREDGITVIFSHERSVLPRVDTLWEMESGDLHGCGTLPHALVRWRFAPPYIRYVLDQGLLPENIRFKDAWEATCRTRD